jgi:hypothetical protein
LEKNKEKKPMSENIKVVKITTGETLVTEYADNGDTVTLTDPHIIIPAQENSIALMPWIPYSTEQDSGVEIGNTNVLMVIDPVEPLKAEYLNKEARMAAMKPPVNMQAEELVSAGPKGADG